MENRSFNNQKPNVSKISGISLVLHCMARATVLILTRAYSVQGCILSKSGELAFVEDRMKETKRRERIAIAFLFLGLIIALVGVTFWWLGLFGTLGIWIGVLGIVFGIIEIIGYVANSIIYSKLMRESETMTNAAPTCPRCGKEIPKGNRRFCPYCGSKLTPAQRVKSRRGK